ncbi:MAG: hypothetical protein L0F95_07995 [Lactococcus sp.]|nr:hypothetical protein [Lactococcus sp.]MDN5410550.1 hypothetical protein [Lactococcus sp.]MDN5412329.1 hypothetical protein [Lactococcus sp.]MDN5436966.1 hypothetical protein [Lactococcus sp.]MDN5462264.1 hypothetical protein [Lactococcus sp.]MDN5466841.1 hypothetical protein [Lactococcus sp.]
MNKVKNPKFYAGAPISGQLYKLVYKNFYNAIDDNNKGAGINFYDNSLECLYGIVIVVNVWESVLNEVFQNDYMVQVDGIFNDAKESIEKWDIKTKTLV